MSTKSSLALVEWSELHSIHIYREMLDNEFYIESEEGRVKVPEKYAKLFAKALKVSEGIE